MSNNINSNLFSINTISSKDSPFGTKSFRETLQESQAQRINTESVQNDDAKDSVSLSNESGTSSVSYDFSNFNQKNYLADA